MKGSAQPYAADDQYDYNRERDQWPTSRRCVIGGLGGGGARSYQVWLGHFGMIDLLTDTESGGHG